MKVNVLKNHLQWLIKEDNCLELIEEILKLKDELYQIISSHSGQPIDRIRKDGDRDYWMNSTEAKEYGMVDEVLLPKK